MFIARKTTSSHSVGRRRSARSRGEGLSGPYARKMGQFQIKVITAETGPLQDAEMRGLVFLHLGPRESIA